MTAPSCYRHRVFVDPAAVRARRFEVRLSEFDVAEACGVEATVIRRLERGHDQSYYDLGFIDVLATVLGCSFSELLLAEHTPEATQGGTRDSERLGAVLASCFEPTEVATLADTMGWPLRRTLAALGELEKAYQAVGQRLLWVTDSHVMAVPAPSRDTARLAARSVTSEGLTASEARGLWNIATSRRTAADATALAPGVAPRLCRAGLVVDEPNPDYAKAGRLELTEQARFDLCLDAG